jgi:hypothetical protein
VPYTLKVPDIQPSVVPPGNDVVVNMPSVGGVPPTDYQIMEIIIESSKPIFPVTVVIYDENGKPVFSVSVVLRDESCVFISNILVGTQHANMVIGLLFGSLEFSYCSPLMHAAS